MPEIDQLSAALIAAQKLEKKLRQLRNRGDCTDADLADAVAALTAIRAIYDRHGLFSPDIDSQGERRRRLG